LLRFICIFWFLTVVSAFSFGQCKHVNTAYAPGEVVEYEVYYNWGIIWLNAGWVRFQVKEEQIHGKEAFLFDSYGSSHSSYDWLYKVRDHYISYIDTATLKPIYFHRKNYEGGYEVDNKYTFNWNDTIAYSSTWNSNKPLTYDTLKITECTFDLLSMVYYARNIDYNALKVGDKVPVVTIIDNEIFNLFIRYLGKEEIKHKNGRKYKCVKFSALLVEGTIFKGGEDMTVWVTDDKNKVPVLVEAKILIGSVKAYIRKTKGLRHSL
jgi:hypothetical protein